MEDKRHAYCHCGSTHQLAKLWAETQSMFVESADGATLTAHGLLVCNEVCFNTPERANYPRFPVKYCDCKESFQSAFPGDGWDCQGLMEDIDDETYKQHRLTGSPSAGGESGCTVGRWDEVLLP